MGVTKAKTFEVTVTRMPRVICAVCGASVFYRPEFTTGAWELAVHVTKAGHAREGPRVPGRGITRGPSQGSGHTPGGQVTSGR